MKKFNDLLEKVLLAVIVLMLVGMTVVVIIGIGARYVFMVSIPWTEEMARYLMIWTAFTAFGVAYRRRELILVRLMVDRLPRRLFELTSFICDGICGVFLAVVIIYGYRLCLMNANQVAPASRIPMSLIYSAIPFGCAICLLYIGESMVKYLRKQAGGN